MRRIFAVAALAAVALATPACGGAQSAESRGRPIVFAAASLTEVFERIDADAGFSFAGSDELAAQLREGAPADVYAAASPRYAQELHAEGIVERPTVFATNTLVAIVPVESDGIDSVLDLEAPGMKVVVGARGVPIGDYTRTVLERLGAEGVVRNVVSEEQDVKGVLAKVAAGEADAGFVYATDAKAAAPDLRTIEIPAAAQPVVEYPIAVVVDAENPDAARAFVGAVLSKRGRAALRSAGFGVP